MDDDAPVRDTGLPAEKRQALVFRRCCGGTSRRARFAALDGRVVAYLNRCVRAFQAPTGAGRISTAARGSCARPGAEYGPLTGCCAGGLSRSRRVFRSRSSCASRARRGLLVSFPDSASGVRSDAAWIQARCPHFIVFDDLGHRNREQEMTFPGHPTPSEAPDPGPSGGAPGKRRRILRAAGATTIQGPAQRAPLAQCSFRLTWPFRDRRRPCSRWWRKSRHRADRAAPALIEGQGEIDASSEGERREPRLGAEERVRDDGALRSCCGSTRRVAARSRQASSTTRSCA